MNAFPSARSFAAATLHIARAHGQTFQRISASRTYSHIVIGRPSLDYALAQASDTAPDSYYARWQDLGWLADQAAAIRSADILRPQAYWADIQVIPVLITRSL